MPKNIIIFSDGTGQKGGSERNTNVYKLFNMIEDRTDRQIAFYDPGVGTDWRLITGNISGQGITKNIQQCYEFIFDNFKAGDQLYMFGFSRGAATVRSLSSFIHMFGILPVSRRDLIEEAFKIYKMKNYDKRKEAADDFISNHHTMWSKIKFLGVWDTVSALGLPVESLDIIINKIPGFRHRFHNFKLSEAVENAYHALAVDDVRKTFHPMIWDKEITDKQKMKQVWFCGVHTDVGGGYKEQGLSDVSLTWMTDMAKQNGLLIYGDHEVTIAQDVKGDMHNSTKGFPGFIYKKVERTWDAESKGNLLVHQSVMERKLNRQNKSDPTYDPWVLKLDHDVEPWNKDFNEKA
jgi:uncharacterized protein (DUF2235 family)